MKYDFDNVKERYNTNSVKWMNNGILPMWVADMDFNIAPLIIDSVVEKLKIGVLGYQLIPEEYFDSYISFWKRRHNLTLNREDLLFSTGVVPSLSSIVRSLTNTSDYVLILSPSYNCFYSSVLNNGRRVLTSDLIIKDDDVFIDFKDVENKMKNPLCTLFILCNPQNPTGRIWKKEELERLAKLAKENNVIILSDEIHCDIVSPGKKYTPLLSIPEAKDISIMAMSASKCFNLAGFSGSCLSVPNKLLRDRINRGLNADEVAEANVIVCDAYIKAFNECEDWLDLMNEYVYRNKLYAYEFIKKELPELKVIKGDATYLIWVDISKIEKDSVKFKDFLMKEVFLQVSDGKEYGENGKSYVRINLATSKSNVIEGLNRLKKGVKIYENIISR